jgi:hypothetical protein
MKGKCLLSKFQQNVFPNPLLFCPSAFLCVGVKESSWWVVRWCIVFQSSRMNHVYWLYMYTHTYIYIYRERERERFQLNVYCGFFFSNGNFCEVTHRPTFPTTCALGCSLGILVPLTWVVLCTAMKFKVYVRNLIFIESDSPSLVSVTVFTRAELNAVHILTCSCCILIFWLWSIQRVIEQAGGVQSDCWETFTDWKLVAEWTLLVVLCGQAAFVESLFPVCVRERTRQAWKRKCICRIVFK